MTATVDNILALPVTSLATSAKTRKLEIGVNHPVFLFTGIRQCCLLDQYYQPPGSHLILLPSCLKVLKPPALPNHSLKHFYTAVIRPILEYCSVVWGHNLSKKQSSQLESIQKTAIRILYQETRHMLYLITVTLHPYTTDAPNKQKVSSHQS